MTTLREEMLNKKEITVSLCPQCNTLQESVHERPNAYDQDVNDNEGSMWTACDECDYQNRMDI